MVETINILASEVKATATAIQKLGTDIQSVDKIISVMVSPQKNTT